MALGQMDRMDTMDRMDKIDGASLCQRNPLRAAASIRSMLSIAFLLLLLLDASAHACSTCFGAQDSAQTQGMNFAILALLGILFCVLGLVGCFVGMLAFRVRKATGSAGASPYRASPTELEGATP